MGRTVSTAAKSAASANSSAEIFLYEVALDDGVYAFCAPGNKSYTIGGVKYNAWPITHQAVKNNVQLQIMETTVQMDNIPQQFSAYCANGGMINSRILTIYQIDRTLVGDPANKVLILQGQMDGFTFDLQNFNVTVKRYITRWDDNIPRGTFGVFCNLVFKSKYCGYTGSCTYCNKTWKMCNDMGNNESFLGFRSVPKELVIR